MPSFNKFKGFVGIRSSKSNPNSSTTETVAKNPINNPSITDTVPTHSEEGTTFNLNGKTYYIVELVNGGRRTRKHHNKKRRTRKH